MSTLTVPQQVKRDVDRMIDYRKHSRPTDQTDIRVKASNLHLHQALRPETVKIANGADHSNLPFSVLYRGYRIVSIPGEKAATQGRKSDSVCRPKPAPP